MEEELRLSFALMCNLKEAVEREQDGRGVGGRGEHLSPRIHQEYTFRHRSACRTPAESRLGVPDQWKRIYKTTPSSVG